MKIKEEAAVMAVREAQIRQEEERLRRDKREFDRERSLFDEEKERIGKLGLEVQKKSLEIEELCSVSCAISNSCYFCSEHTFLCDFSRYVLVLGHRIIKPPKLQILVHEYLTVSD